MTDDGELVCSFMVQAALGLNDFSPMLARSRDQGRTWETQGHIWPELQNKYSIFGSLSRCSRGEFYFYGTRTPIHKFGEPNWCEATQGLKANELIWAHSADNGHTWSKPKLIPMPFRASAEAPGAMCITHNGTWHACYSPFNTFDPSIIVPRNQVVLLSSADQGRSWRTTSMLRFGDPLATGAEAWVVELADGRLLATCWNQNLRDGNDFANAYALSSDGGHTWSQTRSTGIFGQSTALMPLPNGDALFVYCNRRHNKSGIWVAQVQPSDEDFGVLFQDVIWEAPLRPANASHSKWTQFTFGEPSATLLSDGSILVFLWCLEEGAGSIPFVRIRPNYLHC
jgi:hypothetical protein